MCVAAFVFAGAAISQANRQHNATADVRRVATNKTMDDAGLELSGHIVFYLTRTYDRGGA